MTDEALKGVLATKAAATRTFAFTEYPRSFTVAHSGWANGAPGAGQFDPDATDFFITQTQSSDGQGIPVAIKPYDMDDPTPAVVIHLDGKGSAVEEWTIQNYTLEYHAFHIHQMHFRDITTGTGKLAEEPMLDVINVPPATNVAGQPTVPGQVTIKLKFTTAQLGEFLFHCHVMEHEDNGMMAKIQVVRN